MIRIESNRSRRTEIQPESEQNIFKFLLKLVFRFHFNVGQGMFLS